MNLREMKDKALIAERERLSRGEVGIGFDKEYMPQILEMVDAEINSRGIKPEPKVK